MLCVLIGDSNEYTQYTISNIKKKITLNYPNYSAVGCFSKGFKKRFETAVANEPPVFEPLKVYSILRGSSGVNWKILFAPSFQKCFMTPQGVALIFFCLVLIFDLSLIFVSLDESLVG